MRKKLLRTVNLIAFLVLTAAVARPIAGQTITVEATSSSIQQVQENISGLTSQINDINENIENMEEQQEILEEEMADLNAEIINTMTSIGMKQDEIAEKAEEIEAKAADIEATSTAYEEAKEQETEQYQDMVIRLRKMYEGGDTDYINWMMSGDNLGDSLNRMDYVEKIYEFDRLMLEEYEAAKEQVMDLWNQLEDEKLNLEAAKADLEVEKEKLEEAEANLNVLLAKKQRQSANYDAEIKKAKAEANIAKTKLQQEKKELKRLQKLAAQNNQGTGGTGTPPAADGNYTSDYNSIIDAASGSDLGKKIAKYACQYIGNPYVYGGTSLTNGADCSGFTYRVYQDFGYSLPRTSSEQQSAGTGVNYNSAQPGDLICYSGHVGIYIGGGKIVHASTERTGIKVSNATYRSIAAVRRIL